MAINNSNILNPKGSNVYRNNDGEDNSTPLGSHVPHLSISINMTILRIANKYVKEVGK